MIFFEVTGRKNLLTRFQIISSLLADENLEKLLQYWSYVTYGGILSFKYYNYINSDSNYIVHFV